MIPRVHVLIKNLCGVKPNQPAARTDDADRYDSGRRRVDRKLGESFQRQPFPAPARGAIRGDSSLFQGCGKQLNLGRWCVVFIHGKRA